MEVVLKVPNRYFLNYNDSDLKNAFTLSMALIMYQEGKISSGAACELANVDKYTFMKSCKKLKIPMIKYEFDNIESELEKYESLVLN